MEPPVEPGREEARDWLWTELQRAEYADRESLLQRLIGAVTEWLRGLRVPDTGLPSTQFAVAILVLVVVVLAVAWFVAGPVRRERRAAGSAVVVERDDTRTAARMRAAADAAAHAGDWSAAVAERYRAVVRSCEERVVIDFRPGRTAQEAAVDIGARLPELAARLHVTAGLFDRVEYGGQIASAADDAALRDLDDAVTAARVERTAPAPAAEGGNLPPVPAETAGAASAGIGGARSTSDDHARPGPGSTS
ncbi:DUF4129 domain-containing protein [Myceligenerans indicum]|nr:DUF4129 domain-containing protein [Myceligenerans indicum]